jgi:hypothetical protein
MIFIINNNQKCLCGNVFIYKMTKEKEVLILSLLNVQFFNFLDSSLCPLTEY